MNMKTLARIFNKELHEEFIVFTGDNQIICKFTEQGLFTKFSGIFILDNDTLGLIITGKAKVKEEWKPKNKEKYYTLIFNNKKEPEIIEEVWMGDGADYAAFMTANCFKSKELANKYKDRVKRTIIDFYNTHTAFNWEDEYN